jgi:RNA polymerase sigma factor (sigma-70 family)
MRAHSKAGSDRDLLTAVRAGDRNAYGALWARHAEAIRTAASFFTNFDADDITAETFTRILRSIERGHGPVDTFRTYALVTARNIAAEWSRGARNVPLDLIADVEDPALSEFAAAVADDRSLAMRAFHTLPDRWQEVLWYSEVEQMKPAEIAPLLGMSANSVAALAVRAREGLKQGWISAHLRSENVPDEHKWVIERAAKYARNKLPATARRTVDEHLEECPNCRLAYTEIDQASSRIALVLLPVVLGTAAPGYAAWIASRSGTPGEAHTTRPRTVRASTIGGAAFIVVTVAAAGIAWASITTSTSFHDDLPTRAQSKAEPEQHIAPSVPSSEPKSEPGDPSHQKADRTPGQEPTTAPPEQSIASLPDAISQGTTPATTPPIAVVTAPHKPATSETSPPTAPSPPTKPAPPTQPSTPVTPPSEPTNAPAVVIAQEQPYLVPQLSGTATPGATVRAIWTLDGKAVTVTAAVADQSGAWAAPPPSLDTPGAYTVAITQIVTKGSETTTSTPTTRTVTVTDELTIQYTRVVNGYRFDIVGHPGTSIEVHRTDGTTEVVALGDTGAATLTSPTVPDADNPAITLIRYTATGTHGIDHNLSFLQPDEPAQTSTAP